MADDDATILYKLGEAFFHLRLGEAKRQLRSDLKRYEEDIVQLEDKAGECAMGMNELKVLL